jgi:hypothetical protein
MHAKTVNETISFKRGQNPKKSLGIGGINLGEVKYEMKERAKEELEEKWKTFLHELLDDKTITAQMTKLPRIDPNTNKTVQKSESGEFTIKVVDWDVESIEHTSIVMADEDDNIYQLWIDGVSKIFIE